MRLRRLGWAGLELKADEQTVVVDPLLDPGLFAPFLTESPDPLVAAEPATARAALLTHLHRDHADITALRHALRKDGVIARPHRKERESKLDELTTSEAEAALAAPDLDVRVCEPGDVFDAGPFRITALFASDGLGSPQVSWLIEADGERVVHAGDTLWHGGWWDVAILHGPIDVACLPANGVTVAYPLFEPAVDVPAVMSPEQAVEAARALRARCLVPIHFDRTFEHPEMYRPVPDAESRLPALASQAGVELRFLEPGEWVEVADLAAGDQASSSAFSAATRSRQ